VRWLVAVSLVGLVVATLLAWSSIARLGEDTTAPSPLAAEFDVMNATMNRMGASVAIYDSALGGWIFYREGREVGRLIFAGPEVKQAEK